MADVMHQGWADQRLARLYHEAEALSEKMPSGSTERGCLAAALRQIELADTYVEKRIKEAV